ncbi:MAG: LysR family transcriptional regulator [Alphaproteobacteria bacterium]|nr:LysR family transcriptional regulator [Alphaproteobacteria bacterium]
MQRIVWDDLKVFAAVARGGNYTQAAHALRTTGATVGRRIQRLERELGVKLFSHLGSDAHLTDAGRRVLGHVSAAECAIAQASAPIAPEAPSVCRLMCGDGLGSYWLPQFIPAFFERHPHIDLVLFAGHDRYGSKPPLFDLKIQYTETSSQDLVCSHLGTAHFTFFSAKRYVKVKGRLQQLGDLLRHEVLDLALDTSGQGNIAAWAKLTTRNRLLTNMNGALVETVRHGGGIALLPSFASLIYSELVPVLPAVGLPVPIMLCYERETAKRPAVRATIEYLKGVVFNEAMPWFRTTYEPPATAWTKSFAAYVATLFPKTKRTNSDAYSSRS